MTAGPTLLRPGLGGSRDNKVRPGRRGPALGSTALPPRPAPPRPPPCSGLAPLPFLLAAAPQPHGFPPPRLFPSPRPARPPCPVSRCSALFRRRAPAPRRAVVPCRAAPDSLPSRSPPGAGGAELGPGPPSVAPQGVSLPAECRPGWARGLPSRRSCLLGCGAESHQHRLPRGSAPGPGDHTVGWPCLHWELFELFPDSTAGLMPRAPPKPCEGSLGDVLSLPYAPTQQLLMVSLSLYPVPGPRRQCQDGQALLFWC